MSRLMSAAVLAVAFAAATSPAFADMRPGVISAFRGQVIVSKDELPEAKNDKETVAKIKSARLKELQGTANDDVTSWQFHYTAFLNKSGAKALKLEFITTDKDHRLAADKRLDSVDPKSSVLSGDISISEDEGLAKGKTYTLNLVNDHNQVVSSTPIVMK
ncbi:MAG: hypothetical protein JWO36_5257 [Myxococcales bacterium]|nr:hypothetical protein [Myxococcales bacterium]